MTVGRRRTWRAERAARVRESRGRREREQGGQQVEQGRESPSRVLLDQRGASGGGHGIEVPGEGHGDMGAQALTVATVRG